MIPTYDKFEEVADKCNGNITNIAKTFGVARGIVYTWLEKNPDFNKAIEIGRDKILDMAENAFIIHLSGVAVKDSDGKVVGWEVMPDLSAARYITGTLGRKRGYSNNVDITTNGKELNGLFRVLTKDELLAADEQFDRDY